MKKSSNEQGFSLAELLVVAVLGSLIVMSTYQVVVTNQRVYTAQQVQIQGQQSARGGMDVLVAQLRELSPREGDILDVEDTAITVRVPRGFAHICETPTTSPLRVRVFPVGAPFVEGDEVSIFVENDSDRMDDDRWVDGVVTNIDASSACAGTGTQQRITIGSLTIGGISVGLGLGAVEIGAPIQKFTELEYGLMQRDGESYLGRGASGGALDPLVGPLRAGDGILFEPLDAAGAAVTSAPYTGVAQFRVTLRTASAVRDSRGELVRDSLVSTIYTRN